MILFRSDKETILNKHEKFGLGFLLFIIVSALTLFAGWVTNIIWTFHQTGWDIALGIIGVFVAPVGAIHGIYTWF